MGDREIVTAARLCTDVLAVALVAAVRPLVLNRKQSIHAGDAQAAHVDQSEIRSAGARMIPVLVGWAELKDIRKHSRRGGGVQHRR